MSDFTVTLHLGEWFNNLIHLRVNVWIFLVCYMAWDLIKASFRHTWERYR